MNFADVWERLDSFLRSGIAGSEFTPLRLLTVITLTVFGALAYLSTSIFKSLISVSGFIS